MFGPGGSVNYFTKSMIKTYGKFTINRKRTKFGGVANMGCMWPMNVECSTF